MWLLDTCVLSELSRPTPNANVVAWIDGNAEAAWLSGVTLGELSYGVESMPHGARRNGMVHWFQAMRGRFDDKLLDADAAVWLSYGRLKASLESIGRKQDEFDLLIGATALVHGLKLVTRNIRHFKDMGIPLLNPWDHDPTT